jgi:hypothetical protein
MLVKPARAVLCPPELVILAGASLFVFALSLSAYLDPSIRALHFFQSWMYLAAVGLSLCRSRWGYFVGLSAAGLWDYINLFVTTFFRSGLHWLFASLQAGQLMRLDQIIAVPAWAGNLLVILGSLWAYSRLPDKDRADLGRVALAFALTTAYFAAIIAICQPRYLQLFGGIMHPHRPW